MWRVFTQRSRILLSCSALLLILSSTGCAKRFALQTGGAQFQVLKTDGANCAFSIGPQAIDTLTDVATLSGAMGRVVYNKENINSRPEILDLGLGFGPLDTEFFEANGSYYPATFDSLYAVSLYYAVESGYKLFAGLDAAADVLKLSPDFATRTYIVYDGKRNFADGDPEVTDNAEYLGNKPGGTGATINYVISYPTKDVVDVPLGLNRGIMVHEFTHLITQYLFHDRYDSLTTQSSTETINALGAMEEGLADYFGFMAVNDPAFFDCSVPNSGRNLMQPKDFTAAIKQGIASDPNTDIHEGGAVFASINYEIGMQIGFEANGRNLIRFIQQLGPCLQAGNGQISFPGIMRCQVQAADSASQSVVQQIWSRHLGAYQGQ